MSAATAASRRQGCKQSGQFICYKTGQIYLLLTGGANRTGGGLWYRGGRGSKAPDAAQSAVSARPASHLTTKTADRIIAPADPSPLA